MAMKTIFSLVSFGLFLTPVFQARADSFLVEAGSGAATLGVPSSPGVTPGSAQDTLVADYNDLDSVRAHFGGLPYFPYDAALRLRVELHVYGRRRVVRVPATDGSVVEMERYGLQALEQVEMVGDDMTLDEGGWTCGKNGQSVPVSQGIPTVLVSKMTVGGENVS